MKLFDYDEWTTAVASSEKETYVHIDHEMKRIVLYTTYWRVANRIIKLDIEPDKVIKTADGKIFGVEFYAHFGEREKIRKMLRIKNFCGMPQNTHSEDEEISDEEIID